MKIEVIGKLPRVRGMRHAVGDIVEMNRKYARVFIAAGLAREHTPPRPDIPASPSVPLSVVTESVDPAVVDEVVVDDSQTSAPSNDALGAQEIAASTPAEGKPEDEKTEETPETPAQSTRRGRHRRRDMRAE